MRRIALGLELDTHPCETFSLGDVVIGISTRPMLTNQDADKRMAERRTVSLPARLTWKDTRGTMRFATGVTRNVSDFGVYIECHTPVSIPLYRVVQVQIDREGVASGAVPTALLRGRVLSAVYRVSPASMSTRQGFALRLMVDPRTLVAADQTRATA